MIGKILLHYEITSLLGKGGMAEVYRARDSKLNREIALKILPAESALDPDRRMRFEREAQAVAALKHPNIVTVFSVEQSNGTHFLTMELVEGETLSEHIPERGVSIEKFFELAVPLADAISSAHAKGITHRDLKPINIMLNTDGHLKVLDFGLAKLLETAPSAEAATISNQISATQAGRILGTANYMSPEQAEGKPVDHRTDIFSLGIILYELATGKRPFTGETNMSTLSSIIKDQPAPITDLKGSLPRHLNRIIQHCLAKSPGKRYQSALDVRNDLETLQKEVASGEYESTTEITAHGPSLEIRLPWRALGLFAAGLAIGLAAWILVPRSSTQSDSGAPFDGVARFSIPPPPGDFFLRSRVSPDGKVIAFGSMGKDAEDERDWKTYWRRLDAEETNPIPGTRGAAIGSFSPDSRWYAFVGPASLGSASIRLFKVLVDGSSPPMAIADWPETADRNIVWASDDRIVSRTLSGDLWYLFSADGGEPPSTIKIDGTVPATPKSPLPDPNHLLAEVSLFEEGGYRHDLVVVDLESGSTEWILRNGFNPRWSPTGHVVFSRADKILVVPFDDTKLEVIGGAVTVADGVYTTWGHIGADFDLSLTGTLTYRPGGVTAKNRQMVILNRDGSAEPWGDPHPYGPYFSSSRDGRHLAILMDANMDGMWEIWISETDRPRPRMFALAPAMEYNWPAWSSDGSRLAYTRYDNEKAQVYVASLDQSLEPLRIMETSLLGGAVGFTPDATGVYFAEIKEETGVFDIHLAPVDTTQGEPKRLGTVPSAWIRLSPDCKWLSYVSDQSGQNEVYVCEIFQDRIGSGLQVSEGGGIWPLSWRITGPETYELSYNHAGRLKTVSLSREAVGLRVSSPEDLGIDLQQLRSLHRELLPDGRILLLQDAMESRAMRLNVVVNFHDEIQRRTAASR